MSEIGKTIWRSLSSRRLTLGLLAAAGVAIAAATFTEAAQGPEAGRLYVYESKWFEAVLFLLGANLTANLHRWWPLRFPRVGFLLIHLAVIVILTGAAATRYFGYEGVLAVRKGAESAQMVSRTNHLKLTVDGQTGSRRVHLLNDGPRDRMVDIEVGGANWRVEVLEYWPHYLRGATDDEEAPAAMRLQITSPDGETAASVVVVGDKRNLLLALGDQRIEVGVGPVTIPLPYRIRLEDFVMTTYPGSDNPAYFESFVRLFDDESGSEGHAGRIYTNGPLLYRGFKHFQWSYDEDRQGTILIISRDPGRVPTYAGYGLITLGFCLVMVQKFTRRRLAGGDA
jgi:ResB-like family